MGALDRIAELHVVLIHEGRWAGRCTTCHLLWPCPTRRLCHEAAGHSPVNGERAARRRMMAERDAARADAERLRDLLRDVVVAADRMRDGWADADEAVRKTLWRHLHTASGAAADEVYPL